MELFKNIENKTVVKYCFTTDGVIKYVWKKGKWVVVDKLKTLRRNNGL